MLPEAATLSVCCYLMLPDATLGLHGSCVLAWLLVVLDCPASGLPGLPGRQGVTIQIAMTIIFLGSFRTRIILIPLIVSVYMLIDSGRRWRQGQTFGHLPMSPEIPKADNPFKQHSNMTSLGGFHS